ncbi:helix-turn-helix domain-containing protein [Cryptosporangium aurantiacum]|uniref:DNA binding domain-containing protein, excisionase family n=1 Tax=Cryptosporangium aurantiacum TaxID=134849 RepID=A0A1M7RBI4_9ACTN|nr:helix-turn-helix domain-containing protein [Cryptosporangium aurantiacum]SHN43561.1 DNA binding domain-containing protein, excisionase family [Cryptosporangium aurantiacum]
MREWYSVEQVAELLGLHVKTVRGYVREGRLPASRIGRQYRVAAADLEAFTGRPAPAVAAHVEVSAVVQIDGVDAAGMSRFSTLVLAAAGQSAADQGAAGGGPLRVQTVYDEERRSLRVVVFGSVGRTAELLRLIEALSGEVG